MVETEDYRKGYIGLQQELSFASVQQLLKRVHGNTKVFYLLRNPVEVFGIKESLTELPERFSQGQAFSERAEVRWNLIRKKETGEPLFNAIVLTEDEEVVAELERVGKSWKVMFYDYEEIDDQNNFISPAKLWNKPESRLPATVEYPNELFLIYAVYCDAETYAAQFTRLKARLKSEVKAERSKNK